MTKYSFLKLPCALLITTLLVTGCGDDGDSVEAGSLTKSKFIEKADAICEANSEEIQEEFARYLEVKSKKSKGASTEDLLDDHAAEIVNTIAIPHFEEEVDRIGQLGAPSGDEEEVTAILIAMDQVIEKATEQPKAFIQSGASFGKAAKLARSYGLTACAPS
jgi:hypothetical protein